MTIVSKVKKNKKKERKSVCKRKKPTQGHFTSKNSMTPIDIQIHSFFFI